MEFFSTVGRSDCTLQFYIGGRRIGKSYSTLSHALAESILGRPFIYMRLTQSEMQLCAVDGGDFNPFKSLNKDLSTHVLFQRIKGIKNVYRINEYEIDDIDMECPEQRGLAFDLLTVANIRGIDLSDYDTIIFDEFIPTAKVRATRDITGAGRLFAEAYDTITGNREILDGKKTRVIFLANAFSLNSSILEYFQLIIPIQGMIKRGQTRYTDRERDIYIELCEAYGVSEARRENVLFKALGVENDYAKMANDNQFNDKGLDLVVEKKPDMAQYRPIIRYDKYVVYEANNHSHYYVKKSIQDCAYSFSDRDDTLFQRVFRQRYFDALMDKKIFFENFAIKMTLDKALNVPSALRG